MKRISVKKFPGVFYRESQVRLHNGKPDRSYCICFAQNGEKLWKTIGWASLGVTAQEAHEVRIAILTKIKFGEIQPFRLKKNSVTLGQVFGEYFKHGESTRAHFYKDKCRLFRHFSPHFHLPMENVTLELLDSVKSKLLQQSSAANALKVLRGAHTAINFAIRRKYWCGPNPLSAINGFVMPKEDNQGERFLTPEEAGRLLTRLAKAAPQWHDMAYLSLHTGLRLTEIFGIEGHDIDEQSKVLTIRSKGGAREPVLLSQDALKILLKRRRGPNDLVFPNKRGTRHKYATRIFARTIEQCGLNEGVTCNKYRVWFHTLRHTFASWLAQAGVDIYALMKLMRHKRVEMTQRYAHLIPDQQREHLSVINSRLQEIRT